MSSCKVIFHIYHWSLGSYEDWVQWFKYFFPIDIANRVKPSGFELNDCFIWFSNFLLTNLTRYQFYYYPSFWSPCQDVLSALNLILIILNVAQSGKVTLGFEKYLRYTTHLTILICLLNNAFNVQISDGLGCAHSALVFLCLVWWFKISSV